MINISRDREELMDLVSQKNCIEFKKFILENPGAPLLVFVGEEAWSGEYGYECAGNVTVSLEDVTLYEKNWLSREDYEENIWSDMSFDEKYENLSNEEFEAEFKKIMEETVFVKAIVVYVG